MDCEVCMEHSALSKEVETLRNEVNDIKAKQTDMFGTQIEIKVKLDQAISTLATLAADVKALVSAPANNWNKVVTALVTSGVGTLMGFMIGKMLK